jgi:hypothetical protein
MPKNERQAHFVLAMQAERQADLAHHRAAAQASNRAMDQARRRDFQRSFSFHNQPRRQFTGWLRKLIKWL